MSKLAMKKIFMCGLRKDGKALLDLLQRSSVAEISVFNVEGDELLSNDKYATDKAVFDKYVKNCDDVIEIVEKYSTDNKKSLLAGFEGAKAIGTVEYNKRVADVKTTMKKVGAISEASKEISELKAEIPKIENKIIQYKPWENLDIPLSGQDTKNIFIMVGSVKNDVSVDDLYQSILEGLSSEASKYVDIEVLSRSKEMTCFIVIGLKPYFTEVENQLKKIEFDKAPLSKYVPRVEIDNLKNEIKNIKANIRKHEEKIREYSSDIDSIKFCRDYYAIRSEKYDTITRVKLSNNAYFMQGYVPEKYADDLVNKINKLGNIYVEITDVKEDEDAPVALSNGFLSDPMETVVESYSMPNNNEIDPSKILAVFYYMLFGLMLSDAGYGLLLVLGTGFLLANVKNMQSGMKKMMKLFFFGGIWTIIWGILFGSVFGNAVDVIAMYVRGDGEVKPVLVPFLQKLHVYWFDPVTKPMKLLVFAFCIGIVHLMTGLLIKGYLCLKHKDIKGFVYDVIFWIMFVGGGIAYLLTMEMVTGMIGMEKPIGGALPTIAGIVMGLGCLGVVLTAGRESRNWFKRLLKGAYGAYGITGWLSDVLSYSRLLALGLATGIIAQVFNTMGSMVKIPVLGFIIFLIVFVVGHVLNLGINVLGAYVHTNRLQFVEFFGKFYEGGGRKYTPFTENTKYYYIKED